jgi:DNA gyrase/topoisomerase IV subunit A
MNVLVKGKVPKVLGLAECLREWLDHRRDVLLRRSATAWRRSSTGSKCSAAT